MEKDYFVKLTLALYRVTEVFPEKEPLRFSLREKANEVLADLISVSIKNPIGLSREQKKKIFEQVLRNIGILQGYFEVAESQKWLKEVNFLVLKREYDKIEKEIKKESFKKEVLVKTQEENFPQLPFDNLRKERSKKILEILREKKTAQVKDFKMIFPQVSKRTLRRDFEYLLKQGSVERIGEKNNTLYKLK